MITYTLSKRQARLFLLHHQRLVSGGLRGGKQSIVEYVHHVGCIQYDPLSIAGHNHELVLQARIPDFVPGLVNELLYTDRVLIDGWDKNMSIYCTEDRPYFRRFREQAERNSQGNELLLNSISQVREALIQRGPLSSLDLEGKEKMDWAWAPARITRAALETMYFRGEVSVHHRVHTRRYYDFTAKLLPEPIVTAAEPNPEQEQYVDWYVLRRVGSIGLLWNKSGDGWLGMAWLKSKERTAAVQRLLLSDKLREVRVEGIKLSLYMRSADAPVLEAVLQKDAGQETGPDAEFAAALAPLDNLLWERELIRQLFGFQYRWEVYKPAAEREYGYYVLPLLCGDRFAARFEPIMDKKNGVLNILRWWWEPGESLTAGILPQIADALSALARCNRADSVVFHPEVLESCGLRPLADALQVL
ncbi:hypothetical protein D3C73_806660 [compost metagenome]